MASPITAPSGLQQGQLMERLYQKHNVNKEHIQVIEAHGNGILIIVFIFMNTYIRFCHCYFKFIMGFGKDTVSINLVSTYCV